jgi:hypothetical protein
MVAFLVVGSGAVSCCGLFLDDVEMEVTVLGRRGNAEKAV